jgi:protein tyrosine/serine phosphatase
MSSADHRPADAPAPPIARRSRNRRGLRRRLRVASDRLVVALRLARGAMDTPWRRALGYFEHVFVDHAMFRYVYLNRHTVVPDVERAAQPSPHHLRAAARRGVRTVVNLRGARPCASYLMERAVCAETGMQLVDFVLTSRAAPSPADILAFDALIAGAERPMLLHCKSGADRAGLASALYLLLHEDRPVEQAMGQLALRYGHFRTARTGVLDAVFTAYKRDNDAAPIDFRTWVATRYDPAAVTSAFRSRRLADLVADRLLTRE